jgi:ABC-type oligopeptide transport system substrate-binding subunit
MTTPSRSISLLTARTSLAFVVVTFALLGEWSADELLSQPPAQTKQRNEEEEEAPKTKTPPAQKKRSEEEEEPPRKNPKRKVIRVEDEDNTKSRSETSRRSAPEGSGGLTQLAEQTNHPDLKAFFRSLAVPYDLVLYRRSNITVSGERPQQKEERIDPTPPYLGNDPGRFGQQRLHFTRLATDKKADKDFSEDPERLVAVRPYEEIALDKVKSFLKEGYDQRGSDNPFHLSRDAMLTAADQALSFVLSWHVSAISTGKRSGKDWDAVEKKLRTQLLEVRLEKMKELANAKDWDGVLNLTHRLVADYGNADERERILTPVADMLKQAISSPIGNEQTKQQAFKRLHDLEMEYPNNPALRPLSGLLKTRAESLLNAAKSLAEQKDADKLQQAREYLKQAEETWPQLKGLGELRRQIRMDYPILHVGVRDPLPKYFSPAWACTDNERRAVELLFESLVKLVPDGSGGFRYRPALAEFPPKVVPLGRQFDLPRNAYWSDGRILNVTDIDFSLGLLHAGKGGDLSLVWGGLLADKVESMKSPFQLTLRMRQGFLDSLAPMTFKILPSGKFINREAFAVDPVTSGPFYLDRVRSGRSDETKRTAIVFVANPTYGQRPTKRGTPHIQEIRFYSYGDNTDLAKELNSHNLDLVLDLTAKQAEELQKSRNPDIVVPMPSPAVPNRRIYFLAINTRKLDDPKLRQALSFAIDREGLLNQYFRGSLKGLHKALNGPFPAGSWACKPAKDGDKDSQTLFNLALAQLQKQRGKVDHFRLKYAADNPAVDEAMRDLCAQVKERTGVELEPMPCTPYQLRDDVEKVQDYDLAYYHYDFPDDCYWLGPLFGPPPGTKEMNIFKYNNSNLTSLLARTKSYREFTKVQEHQWLTQDLLNREMPFIPLWQLDPLLAYRRNVQPSALDPLLVFDNIEEWHLLPK